jgi:hypothetical protein
VPERTEFAERVRLLLDHAGRDLNDAAANQSLCAISKSGASFPAVKYHEGRAAALSRLLRSLRASEPVSAIEHTRRHFDNAARLGGPDWEAYRHGVSDALDEVGQPAVWMRSETAPTSTAHSHRLHI